MGIFGCAAAHGIVDSAEIFQYPVLLNLCPSDKKGVVGYILGVPLTDEAADNLDQILRFSLADELGVVNALDQETDIIRLYIVGAACEIVAAAVGLSANDIFLCFVLLQRFLRVLDRAALVLVIQHIEHFVDIVNIPVNAAAFSLNPAILLEMQQYVLHL